MTDKLKTITILPPEIFNRISAGEVVERPASIAKELIENALDAGATSISIDIIGGGIDKIRISDNGCGIPKGDLKKAFLPHATSKISHAEDLETIATFGFRGEALSSIAAVSEVECLSKRESESLGNRIAVSGGVFSEISEIGMQNGTIITVKNLFFNTPARKKFLKKPSAEQQAVTSIVEKLMLANPSVSFRYSTDESVLYQHTGGIDRMIALSDAFFVLYGKEIHSALVRIEFEKDGYKVQGYMVKPPLSKPNKNDCHVTVNGRVVFSPLVHSAMTTAMENILMKGRFAIYSLDIRMPLEQVDVNVHPAKLEVKFARGSFVFSLILKAIEDVLNPKLSVEEIFRPAIREAQIRKSEIIPFADMRTYARNKQTSDWIANYLARGKGELSLGKQPSKLVEIMLDDFKKEQKNEVPAFAEQSSILEEKNVFKKIGVFLNTYLLIEKDQQLLLIDQHAAHERILYDKITAEIRKAEVCMQNLLTPFLLKTGRAESVFLSENLSVFSAFGFEISEFGEGCFKITAVPYLLREMDLQAYFDDVLSQTDNLLHSPLNALNDKLKQMACKAAVKGGTILSDNEIESLLNQLEKEKTILLCPHGRPIIVILSVKEIEKKFKRIL